MRVSRLLNDVVERVAEAIPENPVVYDFLNLRLDHSSLNFLDVEVSEGKPMLTYFPSNRAKSVEGTPAHEIFFAKGRQSARVGAVLKKVLVDKYPDEQIKQFVEQFASELKRDQYEISMVSGNDILPYYLADNYLPGDGSELWKSCMRYDHCQDWMGIYAHDPNLKLAIATQNGRLAARALVWEKVTLDEEFHKERDPEVDKLVGHELKFMDRIYAISPIAKNVLWAWGLENVDLMHCVPKNARTIYIPSAKKQCEVRMIHPAARWQFAQYPWIDTLHYLDFETRTMRNYLPKHTRSSEFGGWKLNVSEGRVERITDKSPKVGDVANWVYKHGGKTDEELIKLEMDQRARKLKKLEKSTETPEAPTPITLEEVARGFNPIPVRMGTDPRMERVRELAAQIRREPLPDLTVAWFDAPGPEEQ